jgi:hypothetical protein
MQGSRKSLKRSFVGNFLGDLSGETHDVPGLISYFENNGLI